MSVKHPDNLARPDVPGALPRQAPALFTLEHEARDLDAMVALNDRWNALFAPFLVAQAG